MYGTNEVILVDSLGRRDRGEFFFIESVLNDISVSNCDLSGLRIHPCECVLLPFCIVSFLYIVNNQCY